MRWREIHRKVLIRRGLAAHIAIDETGFSLRLRDDGQLDGDMARSSLPVVYEIAGWSSRKEDRGSGRVT
ncbi:MAG: hypothetical protein K0S79_2033 [Nitrospira sp.]|jgi:hypothetical protein|nr:hypothetical protein [Nitrospira sp.]